MSSIEDLTALVVPPDLDRMTPVTYADWEVAESELGYVLPQDFKDVTVTYGKGEFDKFMFLYDPHHMVECQKDWEDVKIMMQDQEKDGSFSWDIPYPYEHLLAWGSTIDGDMLLWFTGGSTDPNSWTLLIGFRQNGGWATYDGGVLDWLVEVISNKWPRAAVIYPLEDLVGETPSFQIEEDLRLRRAIKNRAPRHKAVVYARVETRAQLQDLDKQAERMIEYALERGLEVVTVVKEVAFGTDDKRPKLTKLLLQDNWGTLVVEDKDRLTEAGFGWFELFLKNEGRQITVPR